MPKENQEVCSIRIMFPVDSDEQAIDCKKKISEVLSDISEVTMQFGISTTPHKVPNALAGTT